MRGANQGPIPSELGFLIDTLNDYERRLRTLEAPSGEALGSTVAKLAALVANLQAQLDAWAAGSWTNAEIAAQITNTIAAHFAGDVTIGAELKVPNAYNTDITWTRRAGAVGNDGRFGYIPSTRKKKAGIKPADEAELARLLDAEPTSFFYRAELERQAATPGYTPRVELGLIAEDLEELGLGAFVYHDADGKPEGIEYSMLTVPLLAIFRGQRDELAALTVDVEHQKALRT